ncbi:NlpC/P60 family protein [Desulfovibrio aminophilus]|uniref:NlpC/P60 family protein n=1 Tax=Desulfovibrio aminophilus TaxID=81425 RepID=UPI00041E2081|nr:NlpC/P60 family protein [Desulfovibrio aminophilus]
MSSPDFSRLFTALFRDDGRGEIDPVTRCPLYDCWGLVMAAHRLYGVELPDLGVGCTRSAAVHEVWARETRSPRWRTLDAPEAPCVVVLRGMAPGAAWARSHFGTYVGGGDFIHITRRRGVQSTSLAEFAGKVEEIKAWAGGRP